MQMNKKEICKAIEDGKTTLGIEFGSTRIKAVLINDDFEPIAAGSYEWENRYENGVWTYHLEDVWAGLQVCYQSLQKDVLERYAAPLQNLRSIGISAMMHGYLPFDDQENLLVPFRTWRNTITAQAAEELTGLFQFNIPQRWSVAHLYQAILNQEPHVPSISFLTTLAGYVHWKLTDKKVIGIGDASGMFPIDSYNSSFHETMLDQINLKLDAKAIPWNLQDILPRVLLAGEPAGVLTEEIALLSVLVIFPLALPFLP